MFGGISEEEVLGDFFRYHFGEEAHFSCNTLTGR